MRRLLIPLFLAAATPLAALTEQATTEAALQVAARDGRVVMLECTGSDWCTFCIHLHNKILASPEFDAAVGDKVVLVTVDYPRSPELVEKIGKEEREKRERLLAAYGIRGLPTVIMLDEKGLPFALLRGSRRTTEEYLPLLNDALELKAQRDAAFARAAGLQGLQRAQALDAALKLLPEPCRDKYRDVIAEIIRLDPQDSLGYASVAATAERRLEQATALRLLRLGFEGKFKPEELKECLERLDSFIQQPGLLPEIRQQALMSKADTYAIMRDIPAMHACHLQALDAAPNSEFARKLRLQLQYEETQLLPRLQK